LAGAFAVAAAVALGVGIVQVSETPRATDVSAQPAVKVAREVVALEGPVSLERAGEDEATFIEEAQELSAGDVVVTGASAAGSVRLSETTSIDLAASTRLSLRSPVGPAERVHLSEGHIAVRVDAEEHRDDKLRVETPDATVVVVGTVFTVDVSARDRRAEGFTDVAVVRGAVRIEQEGRTVAAVRAGETWSSRPQRAERSLSERAQAPDGAEAPPPAPSPASVGTPRRGKPGVSTEGPEGPASSGTLALENDLFQRALEARNAGNVEEAVLRFEELVRRFPESPLVGEARAERGRARAAMSAASAEGAETP
jgi:hypothetical protein